MYCHKSLGNSFSSVLIILESTVQFLRFYRIDSKWQLVWKDGTSNSKIILNSRPQEMWWSSHFLWPTLLEKFAQYRYRNVSTKSSIYREKKLLNVNLVCIGLIRVPLCRNDHKGRTHSGKNFLQQTKTASRRSQSTSKHHSSHYISIAYSSEGEQCLMARVTDFILSFQLLSCLSTTHIDD